MVLFAVGCGVCKDVDVVSLVWPRLLWVCLDRGELFSVVVLWVSVSSITVPEVVADAAQIKLGSWSGLRVGSGGSGNYCGGGKCFHLNNLVVLDLVYKGIILMPFICWLIGNVS